MQKDQALLGNKRQIEDLTINVVKLQNEKDLLENDIALYKGKAEMTSSMLNNLRMELANSKMKNGDLERKQLSDLSTIESLNSEINKMKFQYQSISMSLLASQDAYQTIVRQVN